MTRDFFRAESRAALASPRSLSRRHAALLAALLVGAAAVAVSASGGAAFAQIKQKEVADQVAKAEASVARCDVDNAKKQIAQLEKTKDNLFVADKAGVKGAKDDANQLVRAVDRLSSLLKRCPDPKTATSVKGPQGETYLFANKDDAANAETGIADALRAARECDREAFKRAIQAIATQSTSKYTETPAARAALYQLSRDLAAAETALFAHCQQPGKSAEAPKTEPGNAEPAKTGTGTGTGTTPGQAPKPPSDSPGQGHGSVPTLKFNGEVFANVALMPQFGAGTAINGGRHSIVESPGTISGAGFNLGLDIPTTLNAFGTGMEPSWSINIGFARATGRSSGELAPGAATTGFDYIAPNPASGLHFINHFLNGQVVYIDSERNQLDAEILHNVKWQMTLNTMIPATPVEASAGVGFQFRAIWDSHQVNQSIINFPDVTSTLNLGSSTYFIAPKLMVRGEYEVGRFEFYVGAYVAPGLVFGSGHAEQQARCSVCAASEQSVNLSRDDSFVKFAVNTGARAWVSYELTPAVKARAFVGYDYFSNTARWQLDPGNAYLKGGSTGTWRMGLGLTMRF